MQMFFTAFVLCILILFKLKTEGQTVYRNPHYKDKKKTSNTDPALLLGLAIYHIRPSISVDISYDR